MIHGDYQSERKYNGRIPNMFGKPYSYDLYWCKSIIKRSQWVAERYNAFVSVT